MRSIFGATLPLAGAKMYEVMTPRMAGTFLGLLELVLIPIPWIFYRRGERIRARSPVIRQMRDEQVKNDRKRARGAAKNLRQQERGQDQGQGEGDGAAVSAVPKAVLGGALEGRAAAVVEPKSASREEPDAVALNADVEKGPGS
jgi:hypothetical protein